MVDRPTSPITFQHSPTVETRSIAYIETGPKLGEDWRQQTFGEDIGILWRSGNMQDTDLTKGDLLSDEV
jgi:hypothetical protein